MFEYVGGTSRSHCLPKKYQRIELAYERPVLKPQVNNITKKTAQVIFSSLLLSCVLFMFTVPVADGKMSVHLRERLLSRNEVRKLPRWLLCGRPWLLCLRPRGLRKAQLNNRYLELGSATFNNDRNARQQLFFSSYRTHCFISFHHILYLKYVHMILFICHWGLVINFWLILLELLMEEQNLCLCQCRFASYFIRIYFFKRSLWKIEWFVWLGQYCTIALWFSFVVKLINYQTNTIEWKWHYYHLFVLYYIFNVFALHDSTLDMWLTKKSPNWLNSY